MQLRDYQQDILEQLLASTSNDLVQLDTGAGKTPIEAALAGTASHCILVAHRNFLVEQISSNLATFALEHDVVGTELVRRRCAAAHVSDHGRSFIRRGHRTLLVASVDSLWAWFRHGRLHLDRFAPWLALVDEAHHVVPDNKWGAVPKLLPRARIVGFTATPARLDGQPLHVSCGGLFETLIQAQALRENSVAEHIRRGHLADFDAYSPAEELPPEGVWLAGEPLLWHRRLAAGLQTLAMCPGIENARQYAREFRDAGVPAACIDSKMHPADVSSVLQAFAARELQVLFNVDMVTEGFDSPHAAALLLLRRTRSLVAYRQWVGRVLRPGHEKRAVIIDLAGNIALHGLPDDPVVWDILKPPRGLEKLRSAPCASCGLWYSITMPVCPGCGEANPLTARPEIGGRLVEVFRLDVGLVRHERERLHRAQVDEQLQREVVWPYFPASAGAVSTGVERLRRWFVAQLESTLPPAKVNGFLRSQEAGDIRWWTRHFTLADASSANTGKALKAFRAWEKSR